MKSTGAKRRLGLLLTAVASAACNGPETRSISAPAMMALLRATPGATEGHNATAAAGTTITIRGVVSDNGLSYGVNQVDGGKPVPDALVYLEAQPDIRTKSAVDGRFELVNVPPGDHVVVAEKLGDANPLMVRMPVAATAGTPSVDLAGLVMRRTGTVTGQVNLSDGASAMGVDVYIPGTTQIAKANARGAFALNNVADGTYQLTASRAGYEPASSLITVKAGQAVAVDLELVKQAASVQAAAGLKGIVILPSGQPAPAVAVLLSGYSTVGG